MIERKSKTSNFSINWVLINQIAISSAPFKDEEFELIKEYGIASILCLCNEKEYPNIYLQNQNEFKIIRKPLPDHRSNKFPEYYQFDEVILEIEKLIKDGPVLIHCLYAIERSPSICLAWLVISQKIEFYEAFEYLMSVHKRTNPSSPQLQHLRKFIEYTKNKRSNT